MHLTFFERFPPLLYYKLSRILTLILLCRYLCRIRWLLMKAEEDFQDSCLILLRMDKCQPTYVNLPWTKVITAVIEHRLLTFAVRHLPVNYLSSCMPPCLDPTDQGSVFTKMLPCGGVSCFLLLIYHDFNDHLLKENSCFKSSGFGWPLCRICSIWYRYKLY